MDRSLVAIHRPLPGEIVGTRHAGVASRAGKDRARDVVPRCSAFAPEFAEHLVAVLVSPDAPALETRGTVYESDHLGVESDAGTSRAREQHRAPQIDDRRDAILTDGDAVAG